MKLIRWPTNEHVNKYYENIIYIVTIMFKCSYAYVSHFKCETVKTNVFDYKNTIKYNK